MEPENNLAESSIIIRSSFPENENLRSEIAEIVSVIADKRSIPALINLLDDSEYDIRWIAAEGLIKIGRKCIMPLIRSIKDGRSPCFPGKGAYHVLQNLLTSSEKNALKHMMSAKEK